ncbi:hypothetical protein JHK82_040621 [Glycine max]|nr:hypothetical protein JHK86_040815 [Glycine max]KAG5111398.1 hypothetical protein JHK82_040621 [Glycine max]KAG5122687.1 hypothetical protein JHK84_041027 [Glycine max]
MGEGENTEIEIETETEATSTWSLGKHTQIIELSEKLMNGNLSAKIEAAREIRKMVRKSSSSSNIKFILAPPQRLSAPPIPTIGNAMHKHESPVGYVSDMKILFIVKGSSLISLAYGRSWSSTSSSGIWSSEWLVPRVVSNPIETRADLCAAETQVRKLLEQLKCDSVHCKREATAELRLLAKENMDNRIVISNCGAISLIVDLLQSTDTTIQEHSVTTLLNLSINDSNKAAIANAGAIEPLIHVLQIGSPEAKENSAATLFSLSVTEENKIRIGRAGAIRPLVDLLGNGTPRGKKDAATALFNLSLFHENKDRIVQAGAVKNLVDLMDLAARMVDKVVAVLANLATIPEGKTAIGQQGGIPVLVEVIESGSARGKENAAAALLHLCSDNHRYLNMVLQEGAVPPLVALSQSGTPRAKEKV